MIIKDVISNLASQRSISINIDMKLNDDSIRRVIGLMGPKFEYYNSVNLQYQLLLALKELKNQVLPICVRSLTMENVFS